MDWLSRFLEMVEELRQHPQVVVQEFHVFPKIESATFEALEEKYHLTFPQAVRDFYGATNGLQLSWVFKNNDQLPLRQKSLPTENLPWYFFTKKMHPEDGVIMLLPLEIALQEKKLDTFSHFYNTILTGNNFELSVSEDDYPSDEFFPTDFESYLEFLLAGKGLVARRSFFYKTPDSFLKKETLPLLETSNSFWIKSKQLNLDQALLKNIFPLCDQVRFSKNKINSTGLRHLAEKGETISQTELKSLLEQHHEFLMAGGVTGQWQVLQIRGMVTAFYETPTEVQQGEQIIFERKNLTNLSFENLELPFANCCTAFAEGVNFSNANFEKSLFTDAFLQGANFCNSNFTNVDFSRSDLRNANFQNTKLNSADFENCDLTGANFRGSRLEGARFVGAILEGISF